MVGSWLSLIWLLLGSCVFVCLTIVDCCMVSGVILAVRWLVMVCFLIIWSLVLVYLWFSYCLVMALACFCYCLTLI